MIAYAHRPDKHYPHLFMVNDQSETPEMLAWIEARLGKRYTPHDRRNDVQWFYYAGDIGMRNAEVAMEFRLRWC